MKISSPRHIFLGGLLWLAGLSVSVQAAAVTDAPVTIVDEGETVTMANGVVAIKAKKADGNIISIQYKGLDMLSKGGGYFNIYGGTPGEKYQQNKGTPSVFSVTQDPAKNGGEMGEINFHFPYLKQPNVVPLDIDIRFTLHRGDSAVYAWTIADHAASYPAFDIGVCTVCLKMNPDVVDFLSIDSRRQKLMPTPLDWVKGTQLNLWEARVMNTGVHKGEAEHKYDYNMLFSETPAWGWSSTTKNAGLFIVNPSIEYINGPPVMCDYGGHIDVKPSLPADPTLLFIWHSPHYGGKIAQINANEAWRKVVGPFLFYCDSGPNPAAMYQEAMARASQEQKAWPYEWAVAPGYEHASQRGSASGQLLLQDPQAPHANAAHAWVGLAAPPYDVDLGKGGKLTIDWQTDGKHYGYWVQANADGQFTIPNARPGTYNLYAFTNGVLGTFCHENVVVEAGKTTNLGNLTWTPVRYGRQLWDIGIPDRSAAEFRHGDHYWQWGLYGLYPQEFPNDVNYIIGQSNYHTDWNYAQPPRPADAVSAASNLLPAPGDVPSPVDPKTGKPTTTIKTKWLPSTWHIRYRVDQPLHGTATLRLAICGFRGGPVDVTLNGKTIGSTGEVPESGVMHRDGIRSDSLIERDIKFDAALLTAGENVFGLTKEARAWPEGVLYDYLRLELDDSSK